jgi:5-methylcytosine-specific restriction protein A
MGLRPLKPCSAPACPALVRGARYCEAHASLAKKPKRDHDQRRGNSAQRGYGHKWRKVRLAFLQSNPLCVRCQSEGRVKAATDVDHIVPHRGDQAMFWDVSNYQALCHSHHSEKTATEDSGFGSSPEKGRGGSNL